MVLNQYLDGVAFNAAFLVQYLGIVMRRLGDLWRHKAVGFTQVITKREFEGLGWCLRLRGLQTGQRQSQASKNGKQFDFHDDVSCLVSTG